MKITSVSEAHVDCKDFLDDVCSNYKLELIKSS